MSVSTQPGPQGQAPVPVTARPWTAGRIVALIAGIVLTMVSFGFLAGGSAVLWADQTQRDDAGYVTSTSRTFSTGGYALVSEKISLHMDGVDWASLRGMFGDVRIRVDSGHSEPVFVGIAATDDADRFLSGVQRTVVTSMGESGEPRYRHEAGGAPSAAPADSDIWVAEVAGTGSQQLTWPVADGDWTIVVMNADATEGVTVTADIGAELPNLGWLTFALFATGAVLLIVGTALIVGAVAWRRTAPRTT